MWFEVYVILAYSHIVIWQQLQQKLAVKMPVFQYFWLNLNQDAHCNHNQDGGGADRRLGSVTDRLREEASLGRTANGQTLREKIKTAPAQVTSLSPVPTAL